MADLSDWVRRDGKEIVYGPERNPTGWQYVYKSDGGNIWARRVNDGGFYESKEFECSEDLIPPPEYGYLFEDEDGKIWAQIPSEESTYRYIKGQFPETLERIGVLD